MINRLFLFLLGFVLTSSALASAPRPPKPDSRLYELRIYYPNPGKYEAIVDRFRQHTLKLFGKHGMTNIGYWTPTDTSRKELLYILAYPNRDARDAAWKAFGNDPAWQTVRDASEVNGKLVNHVDQVFMTESDLSPVIKTGISRQPRAFELRSYTAAPGKLDALLTRFRDHTLKLFEKHGMTNIGYWITQEKEGVQPRLLYILAHPSEAEGRRHFKEFADDPVWQKALRESEADGKLTDKVESLYMNATDYSPIR